MTTPTNKEWAARLRNYGNSIRYRHDDAAAWDRDSLFIKEELYRLAAALEAMPEHEEEAKKWREAFQSRRMECLRRRRDLTWRDNNALDILVRDEQLLDELYKHATGTRWTPPEPERVTDEELDNALLHFNGSSSTMSRIACRVLEAERARRSAVKEQPR